MPSSKPEGMDFEAAEADARIEEAEKKISSHRSLSLKIVKEYNGDPERVLREAADFNLDVSCDLGVFVFKKGDLSCTIQEVGERGWSVSDGAQLTGYAVPQDVLERAVWRPSATPNKGIDRLVGSLIAMGFITVIAAPGGMGKSTMMGAIAIGLSRGEAVVGLNWIVKRKARCLYLQAEDDQDMIHRSFAGIGREHKITDREVEDRMIIMGKETVKEALGVKSLQMIQEDRGQVTLNTRALRRLKALVLQTDTECLFIDPLAVLYGGAKITNEAQNLLIRALDDMSQELGIAVVIVAHTRKGDGAKTVADVKHGGELTDTSRVTAVINPLTKDEVGDWEARGIVDINPRNVVSLTVVKTNLGPDGERAYMEKKSQLIKCADGREEWVGTMIPVLPPSTAQQRADPALWQMLAPKLISRFVTNKNSQFSDISLKDLILELSVEYDPSKVIKDMDDRGWIKTVKEVPQRKRASNQRGEIGRWVAGPNCPNK